MDTRWSFRLLTGMACTHVVEVGCSDLLGKITPNVWLKETLRLRCFVLPLVQQYPSVNHLIWSQNWELFPAGCSHTTQSQTQNEKKKKKRRDLLNRRNLLVSYQLTFRHRSGSTQRSPQGSSSSGSANLVPVNCAAAPFLTRCWLSSCVEIRDCYGVRLLCQDLFGSHIVSLRSGAGKETKMGAVYPSLTHFWML